MINCPPTHNRIISIFLFPDEMIEFQAQLSSHFGTRIEHVFIEVLPQSHINLYNAQTNFYELT